MASTTTHHQRSSSASINPATLLESCRVYTHNGGASVMGSRTGTSSSSHNINSSSLSASSVALVHPHNNQSRSNNKSSSSDTHSSDWDAELPVCFGEKRHVQPIEGIKCITQSWRMKERMKTVSVALVMCLNVGVDPPDVVKIQPCARMECWIDPSSVSQQKALELIGTNLQKQYERWQPRARYKQSLDPTVEDVKKLCTSLRRNAKDERVLFHYNGHGVPRPTNNGEIWVFNRSYTQYIPLSIYDLQTWMGAPSIYVYDCSNAGIIVNAFNNFAENHERDLEQMAANQHPQQQPQGDAPVPVPKISYKNCIQLAACASNQILPMNPQLPADLFTACLTTPIKIALKWFTLQSTSKLVPEVSYELIERIPGQLNDRRTMLGELNWIFTAITDTIAWNTLPRDLFQKLFRQDLLVASLFRNFLLAERILRSYDCTPISHPPLPQGYRHPMWTAWDLALDLALTQLPRIIKNGEPFTHSPFFEEQLTAFEVWLNRGCDDRNPPEQLPIVLQVLLSQVHRLRALELLGRFLDLGPWAVNLALSVGIFPYVLKLLQSSAKELRPFLVFIWAKILAVDCTCQVDLVRDQGHKYFLSVLQDPSISAEYRTQSAFVLACIVSNYDVGQKCALQGSLVSICLVQLNDKNWRLRQWLTVCLGNLWQNYDKARWSGYRDMAPDKLYQLLTDPMPEVRAAAVYALGTFISSGLRSEHADNIDRPIAMTLLSTVSNDMSPIVRMELVAALQWMVIIFQKHFVSVYLQDPSLHSTGGGSGSGAGVGGSSSSSALPMKYHTLERTQTPMKKVSSSSSIMTISGKAASSASGVGVGVSSPASGTLRVGSMYLKIWQGITGLSRDPYPEVARMAQKIMEVVRNAAVELIAAKEVTAERSFGGSSGNLAHSPNTSVSLPPSPNTRTSYMGRMEHVRAAAASAAAAAHSEDGPAAGGGDVGDSEKPNASAAASAVENQKQLPAGTAIVVTGYIPWAISQFARPSKFSRIGFTNLIGGGFGIDMEGDGMKGADGEGVAEMAGCEAVLRVPKRTTDSGIESAELGVEWTEEGGEGENQPQKPQQSLDRDAPEYLERVWRFKRNEKLRNEARDQQRRVPFIRMETQTFYYKTQQVPNLVKLHAYEPQIAVAYRDKVIIHDWGTGAMHSYLPETVRTFYQNNKFITRLSHQNPTSSHQSPTSQQHQLRVTSLEFVNAHDRSLVLIGYDDGSLRLWRPPRDRSEEPRLISAWAALDMDQAFYLPSSNGGALGGAGGPSGVGSIVMGGKSVSHTNLHTSLTNLNAATLPVPSSGIALNAGQRVPNGMVLTWQQWDQKIVVGGDSKYLRVWDAENEMKFGDIPLNADSAVKTLSSSPDGLIAAGFKDGSVRLFDKRCTPQEAKLMTFRDHTSQILAANIRDDCDSLISGCSQGTVRSYDIRKKAAVHSFSTMGDVTAMSIHTMSDIVACGNQTICIYGLDGKNLGSIRNYEGFMSNRIGQSSCLSFHPHKVSLACGFVDQTAAVFTVEGKK